MKDVKTTGHLKFAYNHYFTVDENDLPHPDEYQDGDRGFGMFESCCDAMTSFHNGYDRRVEISYYANFEVTPRTNHRKLVIEMEADESSTSFEVLVCPWCQAKPEFVLNQTIKRIKTCIEEPVTEIKKRCVVKEQVVG